MLFMLIKPLSECWCEVGDMFTVLEQGVTLPSQRRYVQYFSDMIRNNLWNLRVPKLQLTNIRFTSRPSWKAGKHIVLILQLLTCINHGALTLLHLGHYLIT
jgi:hypothetical protein